MAQIHPICFVIINLVEEEGLRRPLCEGGTHGVAPSGNDLIQTNREMTGNRCDCVLMFCCTAS